MPTSEDYDIKKLPFNPHAMKTVTEFLQEQKKATEEMHGSYKDFECRRCGDCCLWNYYGMRIEDKLMDMLYTTGKRDFHGYWIMTFKDEDPQMGTAIHLYMPIPEAKAKNLRMFHFSGRLSDDHHEFLRVTERRHGYWVMRPDGLILIYNPVPCAHYEAGLGCEIYDRRPRICRDYYCGRYPKVT